MERTSTGLPDGIDLGTAGTISYPGPRSTQQAVQTVDALVAASPALQGLIRDLARAKAQPTLQVKQTTEPALPTPAPGQTQVTVTGAAAQYHTADGRTPAFISWRTGQVDFAVDYGKQNATHILFHEYDHAWYQNEARTYYDLRTKFSPTMSATLTDDKGVAHTYSWTIYTRDAQGHITFNPSGFNGYAHMLIHDDLVAAYGHDQTGALREALQSSNEPPRAADVDALVDQYDGLRPSFPTATATQKARPPAAPSLTRDLEHTPAMPTQHTQAGRTQGRSR